MEKLFRILVLLICIAWSAGFSQRFCQTNVAHRSFKPRRLAKSKFLRTSWGKIKFLTASADTSAHEKHCNKPLKVIIAGAPASGKGTQCEVIKSEFGLIHLSTGDILRAAVKEGSPLGLKAKQFMDAGKLVPDDLIINVVCDRLSHSDCQANGWLLDGFPRTRAQADALKKAGIFADCFILLDVPEDVLVERVEGRRTDPVTGLIYHLKYKPPPNDIAIKERLVQRSDDTAEKIKIRFKDFTSNIDSVRDVYADRIIRIDGTKSSKEVSEAVLSSLKSICQNMQ